MRQIIIADDGVGFDRNIVADHDIIVNNGVRSDQCHNLVP